MTRLTKMIIRPLPCLRHSKALGMMQALLQQLHPLRHQHAAHSLWATRSHNLKTAPMVHHATAAVEGVLPLLPLAVMTRETPEAAIWNL